jgi:NAD(P)-dependent dehydrogenase (short-subunit alcohol dehydrogenase family)
MQLKGKSVLVTGANRGIGLAFAREALARGARRVYAGARDPSSVTLKGVTAMQLDITDESQVANAARHCPDVEILINNAGIARACGFMSAGATDSARQHLETNFFGLLHMAHAFAPVLARNGGGAMLNVLSIASWIHRPPLGIYAASKAANWALTNGLRHELREQGTMVSALHMSFVDTDLTRDIDRPKSSPESIVCLALDAFEAGDEEILADEQTRSVKQSLSSGQPAYLAPL